MQPYESDLCLSVESLWASILGLGIAPAPPDPDADGTMSSGVVIDGAWRGAVEVRCPEPLARRVTAAMFGGQPEAAAPDQIRDALGELANITGGNFKSLLPEPCSLSLPRHEDSFHESVARAGLGVLSRVGFRCEGLPFTITIFADGPSS